MYGTKWTFEIDGPEIRIWLQALADVSVEQARRGLQLLRKRQDHWPPSLPEFRTLCTGIDPKRVQTFSDTDLIAEDTARKLLAGKMQRGGNRIVFKSGLYVWQKKFDGAWTDQPAQRLGRYSVEDVVGV